MTELQFKVGDKAVITDWKLDNNDFAVGQQVTVVETDISDPIYPYQVESADAKVWVKAEQLGPLPEAEPQLDLQTVQHIHSCFADIIHEAKVADKSHEAINIAFLGYLEGLKDGLEGAARV